MSFQQQAAFFPVALNEEQKVACRCQSHKSEREGGRRWTVNKRERMNGLSRGKQMTKLTRLWQQRTCRAWKCDTNTHTHTHTYLYSSLSSAWACNHMLRFLLSILCMWCSLHNCTVIFTNSTLLSKKLHIRIYTAVPTRTGRVESCAQKRRPDCISSLLCSFPSLLHRWMLWLLISKSSDLTTPWAHHMGLFHIWRACPFDAVHHANVWCCQTV